MQTHTHTHALSLSLTHTHTSLSHTSTHMLTYHLSLSLNLCQSVVDRALKSHFFCLSQSHRHTQIHTKHRQTNRQRNRQTDRHTHTHTPNALCHIALLSVCKNIHMHFPQQYKQIITESQMTMITVICKLSNKWSHKYDVQYLQTSVSPHPV